VQLQQWRGRRYIRPSAMQRIDERHRKCQGGGDMRRCRAIALLVVLAIWATGRDARAAERLALHYDVYYLMFPVLSIDVASHVEATAYRTTVALRTAGIFATLVPWQSSALAHGRVDGATLRPAGYRARSEYRDRHQQIELAYEDGGAVRGDVDGMLTDGEREDVPDALRDGTVDPITANVVLAQRLAASGSCAGTVRIFDGLRRYDLRYEDLGMAEIAPSRRDPYRGGARHCRATVHSIAGFLRTGDHSGERATDVSVWLAPPLPGATPIVVRIDLRGTGGTLHVHLRAASALEPEAPGHSGGIGREDGTLGGSRERVPRPAKPARHGRYGRRHEAPGIPSGG